MKDSEKKFREDIFNRISSTIENIVQKYKAIDALEKVASKEEGNYEAREKITKEIVKDEKDLADFVVKICKAAEIFGRTNK